MFFTETQLWSSSQTLAAQGGMLHLWPPLRQAWVKHMPSSSSPPSFKWSNTTHVEGPQLGTILPCGFVLNKTKRRESRHSRSATGTYTTTCHLASTQSNKWLNDTLNCGLKTTNYSLFTYLRKLFINMHFNSLSRAFFLFSQIWFALKYVSKFLLLTLTR